MKVKIQTMLGDIVLRLYDETPIHPERRSSGSQFYIVWGQVYNEGQLRQFSKQLRMQKVQAVFISWIVIE